MEVGDIVTPGGSPLVVNERYKVLAVNTEWSGIYIQRVSRPEYKASHPIFWMHESSVEQVNNEK